MIDVSPYVDEFQRIYGPSCTMNIAPTDDGSQFRAVYSVDLPGNSYGIFAYGLGNTEVEAAERGLEKVRKLARRGFTPNGFAEFCPCEVCETPTQMTSTKRCDGCWEVERRLAAYLAEGGRPAVRFVAQALAESAFLHQVGP